MERLVPYARLEAGAAVDRDERVVQSRGDLAREQDDLVGGERGERDRLLARERMGIGQQRHEALLADRRELELGGDLRAQREGDIDGAVGERREHPGVPHLLPQELDVRVTCPERPAERRERLEAHAPRVGDPQPPEVAGGGALCVLGRPLSICERAPRAVQERASGVGESHLAGRADEEVYLEVAFELSDRGAERRLGHVHPARCAAEVQLLRNGDEVPQVPQLDHARSSLTLPIRAASGIRPGSCWPR